MPADLREQLNSLDSDLRPSSLEQWIRSVVFSTQIGVDFTNNYENGIVDFLAVQAHADAIAQGLGNAAVNDDPVFARILPDLVSADERLWRVRFFGMGLMEGSSDPEKTWRRLTDAISTVDEQSRQAMVLSGFLHALADRRPDLVEQFLDEAVENETLAPFYPYLQAGTSMGERDVVRLKRSLELGRTPARAYVCLTHGGVTRLIPPAHFRELTFAIAALPNGYDVALDVFHMRLHDGGHQEHNPTLIATGQELLRGFTFSERNDHRDYCAGEVAKACLGGNQGKIVVNELCAKLKDAVTTYATHACYNEGLLHGLFLAQPLTSLNALCAETGEDLARGVRILQEVSYRHDLISLVPEDQLLHWCDEQPNQRYTATARLVPFSRRDEDSGALIWTGVALDFLERAPDPAGVLGAFVNRFRPDEGWGASLVETMELNASLLDTLDEFPRLSVAISREKERMREAIQQRRKDELDNYHQSNEGFE